MSAWMGVWICVSDVGRMGLVQVEFLISKLL